MKMRVFTAGAMAMLLFLLAACTPSLYPLYTERDLVFEPGLIGTWADAHEKDARESWTFEKRENKAYVAIGRGPENQAEAEYEFYLVRLGKYLFFDAVLRENRVGGQEADDSPLVRPHWFGRISIQGDSMRFALLDEEWLENAVRESKVQVQHEELEKHMLADGTILLTASTKELQSFVLKYADDEKAFSWGEELSRKK